VGAEPAAGVRVSADEPAPDHDPVSHDERELLEVALQAARMAGLLLLERFEDGVAKDVRSKSTPTDLVSEADLDSQRALRALLAELRPDDGFLGEEEIGEAHGAGGGGEADALLARDTASSEDDERSALRWIVDPLDGTVNFLFGIPQWCVSVAVQDQTGSTLAGAVYDACRDEMWGVSAHGEPTLNGEAVSCSERTELASAMVATGLFYDSAVRGRQSEVLAALVPRVRDIRRFGSAALDLTWTAAGRYDAYFERGVKVWDIAAGALVCERAGVRLAHLEAVPGEPILPPGLLAAPAPLIDALLEIVA